MKDSDIIDWNLLSEKEKQGYYNEITKRLEKKGYQNDSMRKRINFFDWKFKGKKLYFFIFELGDGVTQISFEILGDDDILDEIIDIFKGKIVRNLEMPLRWHYINFRLRHTIDNFHNKDIHIGHVGMGVILCNKISGFKIIINNDSQFKDNKDKVIDLFTIKPDRPYLPIPQSISSEYITIEQLSIDGILNNW